MKEMCTRTTVVSYKLYMHEGVSTYVGRPGSMNELFTLIS